jgi:large subunit ribosomal protein L21
MDIMTKLAVIMTGGKQYVVKPGDILNIERIEAKKDGSIDFDKVLLTADGDSVKLGAPFIAGAKVSAKTEGEVRGKKTIAMRYKNKTRAMTRKGHRQTYTKVSILDF